jgi:hypothetical protein
MLNALSDTRNSVFARRARLLVGARRASARVLSNPRSITPKIRERFIAIASCRYDYETRVESLKSSVRAKLES